MKKWALLLLLLAADSGLVKAQNIYGTSTISINPSTNAGTASCETDLDGEADDGYYASRTNCAVRDQTGTLIATGVSNDDGDRNGFAEVTLSFTATPGSTYTVTGSHAAELTTPFDAPSSSSPQYFDEFNFFNYIESPDQPGADDYDWFGPGPQEQTKRKTITLPPTVAQATDPAGCPTSVTLAAITQEPITWDQSLRTGYGIMAQMNLNPSTMDWSNSSVTETISTRDNTCSFSPFTTTTAQNSVVFRIGGAAVPTDEPAMQSHVYQGIKNAFYDEHFDYNPSNPGKSYLTGGSCVAHAAQTYVCGGKTIGSFTITKQYTFGTANGGPATIVSVTKQ